MSMNSLNHYAYGAIGEWMYERVAGIAPLEAGYKKIRIAPVPGNPLTSAKASVNTPYGKTTASWEIKGNEFQLNVTIPPNTTAEIIIPVDTSTALLINESALEESENIKLIKSDENFFKLSAKAGTYRFKSKLN